jgi:hypothetical protein
MTEAPFSGGVGDRVQPEPGVELLYSASEAGKVRPLPEWIDDISLTDRVGPMTFTPFVGYGAVQSGRARPGEVANSDCVKWDTALELQADNAKDRRLPPFLKRVFDQRIDGRLPLEYVEPRPAVTELRYAFLNLAYEATNRFVEVWASQRDPVCDWQLQEVEIGGDPKDRVRNALAWCREACDAVAEMADIDPLLGLGGLMRRLDATRNELSSGKLSGTLVEWFTEVFWHLMIFDSEVYPRISELSTQVSLMMGSDEPRRHQIPISTVQRGDYQILVEAVRKCLERGATATNRSAARRRFLGKLAEVSHLQFVGWERARLGPMGPALLPGAQSQPAILLTTTLGLDVEHALATTDPEIAPNRIFHVAVPVVASYVHPHPQQKRLVLRWLVGDFSVEGPEVTQSNLRRPIGPWRLLQHWGTGSLGLGWPALQGPLLLKLAGSPLHDIYGVAVQPELTEAEETEIDRLGWFAGSRGLARRTFNHAVALDEFDVIQRTAFELFEIGAQTGSGQMRILPKWLYESMNSWQRWWVYLGPRLTDWNSRMEFVLNRILTAPQSRDPKPVLISRNIRPDHARILGLLNIVPVGGDCFDLTDSLAGLAADLRGANTA